MAKNEGVKTVQISTNAHKLLMQYAAHEDVTIKELVEQAIYALLRQKGFIK